MPRQISAQVTAQFSATSTTGCAPLFVQFNDQSTGNITYRHWYFGNGSQSLSNLTNPSATYVAPGIYSVKLVVGNSTSSDSIILNNYIEVRTKPTSSFITNGATSGCPALSVSFQNNSFTASGGTIASYSWDFGDGSATSSATHPMHTYSQSGTFSASLVVTDNFGCIGTSSQSNIVTVHPVPTASYTTVGASYSCLPPLSVPFANTSQGTGLSYNWDFGNGTASTATSPTANYSTFGYFNVQLVATNNFGCKDTLTVNNYVSIDTVNANFTTASPVYCKGTAVSIQNTSTGAQNYQWTFPDGTTSNLKHPSHVFKQAGAQPVKLVATSPPNCVDSITINVLIEEAVASYSFNKTYFCNQWGGSAFLTNSSTATYSGVVTNFIYGSTFPNSLTYDPTGTDYNIRFDHPGKYSDSLIAITPLGCRDTAYRENHIQVSDFGAQATSNIEHGCDSLEVFFGDSTKQQDSIVYFNWEVDSAIYYTRHPYHNFTKPGRYPVVLNVTTFDSCHHQAIVEIKVGKTPNADFSVADTICASDKANFTNLSTDSNMIDTYIWSFTDGSFSNLKDPNQEFQGVGYIHAQLVVGFIECYDTIYKDSVVYVQGPIFETRDSTNCQNPLQHQFWADTTHVDHFYWDFDDGSPFDSVNINPNHTYTNFGQYNVQFHTFNYTTGCEYHGARLVEADSIDIGITSTKNLACIPDTGLLQINHYNSAGFRWRINDKEDTAWNAIVDSIVPFDEGGYYDITVFGQNGTCTDSAKITLFFSGLQADFTADTTRGCLPFPVQFSDQSTIDTTITNMFWNFGDGQTNTNVNFSPKNTYKIKAQVSNKYNVQYSITDAIGCNSVITKAQYITGSRPDVNFLTTSPVCKNTPLQVASTTPQPGSTFFYDFGDGNSATNINPTHNYSIPGKFPLALTVTDSVGCDSTLVKFVEIEGLRSQSMLASPRDSSCYPANVNFQDIHGYGISKYHWLFGDGTDTVNTNTANVFHTYIDRGVYDVFVKVITNLGCIDSMRLEDFINLNGPKVFDAALPPFICLGDQVDFKIDSLSKTKKYIWSFGDGNDVTLTQATTATHNYAYAGPKYLTLAAYDSSEQCAVTKTDTIIVYDVELDAGVVPDRGCPPLGVNFNTGQTGATNLRWDTRDFVTSEEPSFDHIFEETGNYDVILVGWNDTTGCSDSTIIPIEVFPRAKMELATDATICFGDTYSLDVTGNTITVNWEPVKYLTSSFGTSIKAYPPSDQSYTAIGSNVFGCETEHEIDINVQDPIDLSIDFDKETIFLGDSIRIVSDDSPNLRYLWSPEEFLTCTTCPTPVYKGDSNGYVSLKVKDINGCFAQDTAIFFEVLDEARVTVPSAFTPDHDDLNETFSPITWGIRELEFFQVIDRWGHVVFETNQLNNGWDGQSKDQTTGGPQVYGWRVRAIRYNDLPIEQQGRVTLLR